MVNLSIITVYITFYSWCSAKININVRTSQFLNKTIIEYTGRDKNLVTDKEIALFNITHENSNRGIRIEMGKIPDDIFLRDPTPYENLFEEYKWPEVARVLTIKSAQIIEFKQENIVLKTHVRINNTTVTIKSKTDMMDSVENTVLSLWSRNGLPEDFIQCGVNIDFGYGNWSFNSNWRDESFKSVRLPFGASKGIIDLKSGQSIESKLLGTKIVMLIEIEYTARLVGNIIADYENLYGKYHFYSPTVENIMKAAKLKNAIDTKEYLEMRFYVDPKMKLYDKDTGEELNVELNKRHWRRKEMYNFQ